MTNTNTDTRNLADRVEERKAELQRIIDFVLRMLGSLGKIISRKQRSYNTRTIRRLDDFGKFSFGEDSGQTFMGGNSIEIWYFPFRKQEGTVVLEIYSAMPISPSCSEWQVKTFMNDGLPWRHDLIHAIENEDELVREILEKRKSLETSSEAERRKWLAEQELQAEAKRLGLI